MTDLHNPLSSLVLTQCCHVLDVSWSVCQHCCLLSEERIYTMSHVLRVKITSINQTNAYVWTSSNKVFGFASDMYFPFFEIRQKKTFIIHVLSPPSLLTTFKKKKNHCRLQVKLHWFRSQYCSLTNNMYLKLSARLRAWCTQACMLPQ